MKRDHLIWVVALMCISAIALYAPRAMQSPIANFQSPIPNTQENELRLSLRRLFGFSMGGQVQGTFNLSVQGPSDLVSVTFKLNSEAGTTGPTILGQATQAPFSLTFSTDQFPHGRYELSAVGQTAGGQTIQSNVLRVEFVSAEAGWQAAGKIIVPILVLVGIVMLASFIGPLLGGNGKKRRSTLPTGRPLGEPRDYGVMGGAVCPKCGRPFGLHWWAPNLVMHKLDRCPNCGKWSVVGRASREELAAAEAAEAEMDSAPEVPELSPEEKLRRQIEESKYM